MPSGEVIEPQNRDNRDTRREEGYFTENQINAGKSVAADNRIKPKSTFAKSQGDLSDEKEKRWRPPCGSVI